MQVFRAKRIIKLGLKSLWMHRLRSVLTTMGIVFGVCSVIGMLAIGEGASREAQATIARLGSTNIIIKTVKPPDDMKASGNNTIMSEYGLTYADAERFYESLTNTEVIVPIRRLNQDAWYRNRKAAVEVIGTVPWYTSISSLNVKYGRFLASNDLSYQQGICAIDERLMDAIFKMDNPLGQTIKLAGDYYTVVGIVDSRQGGKTDNEARTGGGDAGGASSGTVYIPLTAVKSRFGELNVSFGTSGGKVEKVELQEITVKVKSMEDVLPTRDMIAAQMEQFHKKKDYDIQVPLEQLREAQRTKRIYSIVLGSIAAISLLVGGIGIMNIMLATVSERTREIGIRRALGAKRKDIITQFITETILLTSIGGILGVVLGVIIPKLVTYFFSMPTVVTGLSLTVAFGVSAVVGIVFGSYPAWRAANVHPIESLRHE
ncbi:MAG: hypothetical protein A2Y07_01965 [Planctomycetes bacterium GWF2_50_10]|nr:MAG: hypothetical protein A2Y07_01965 [Planctomycetes bacterium GWF2_50_10]